MRQLKEIIIHCSATIEGKDYSVETIRGWHKQRGFRDIGYHFVIHPDGKMSTGRPIDKAGAHAKDHNKNSIGICYIGGLDRDKKAKDTRTTEQKIKLIEVIKWLKTIYPTITKVSGHNQYSNKACPCFSVEDEF